MVYYPYLLITGRILGQDEDTAKVFENMTEDQAVAAYRAAMIEDYTENNTGDEVDPEELEVVFNIIATSQSPIEIQYHVVF